jgi:hypothetical protein
MPPRPQRTSRAVKNAEDRLAKFKEIEAAKAPAARLLNRTDWDDDIQKQRSRDTLRSYKLILEWFEDFSVGILQKPPGDSAKYYTKCGPRPSIAMVRQFLTSIAQTHRGYRTQKKAVRLSTMKNYLGTLWGATR